jgi:hypothetical protein
MCIFYIFTVIFYMLISYTYVFIVIYFM